MHHNHENVFKKAKQERDPPTNRKIWTTPILTSAKLTHEEMKMGLSSSEGLANLTAILRRAGRLG